MDPTKVSVVNGIVPVTDQMATPTGAGPTAAPAERNPDAPDFGTSPKHWGALLKTYIGDRLRKVFCHHSLGFSDPVVHLAGELTRGTDWTYLTEHPETFVKPEWMPMDPTSPGRRLRFRRPDSYHSGEVAALVKHINDSFNGTLPEGQEPFRMELIGAEELTGVAARHRPVAVAAPPRTSIPMINRPTATAKAKAGEGRQRRQPSAQVNELVSMDVELIEPIGLRSGKSVPRVPIDDDASFEGTDSSGDEQGYAPSGDDGSSRGCIPKEKQERRRSGPRSPTPPDSRMHSIPPLPPALPHIGIRAENWSICHNDFMHHLQHNPEHPDYDIAAVRMRDPIQQTCILTIVCFRQWCG